MRTSSFVVLSQARCLVLTQGQSWCQIMDVGKQRDAKPNTPCSQAFSSAMVPAHLVIIPHTTPQQQQQQQQQQRERERGGHGGLEVWDARARARASPEVWEASASASPDRAWAPDGGIVHVAASQFGSGDEHGRESGAGDGGGDGSGGHETEVNWTEVADILSSLGLHAMIPRILGPAPRLWQASEVAEAEVGRGEGCRGEAGILPLLALGALSLHEAEEELKGIGLSVGGRKRLMAAVRRMGLDKVSQAKLDNVSQVSQVSQAKLDTASLDCIKESQDSMMLQANLKASQDSMKLSQDKATEDADKSSEDTHQSTQHTHKSTQHTHKSTEDADKSTEDTRTAQGARATEATHATQATQATQDVWSRGRATNDIAAAHVGSTGAHVGTNDQGSTGAHEKGSTGARDVATHETHDISTHETHDVGAAQDGATTQDTDATTQDTDATTQDTVATTQDTDATTQDTAGGQSNGTRESLPEVQVWEGGGTRTLLLCLAPLPSAPHQKAHLTQLQVPELLSVPKP
jgi:hypothetical protein